MQGWGIFAAAFAVFFLSHAIPVRPPVRPWLVARLGPRGFTAAYSVLSLAILAWLIVAANRAPFVPLWFAPVWMSHLALTVMLGVCLLLALTLGRPNPFSFGGARNAAFDPDRPGLIRYMRHPLLVALGVWALAHLLANGDLAHVILFGAFAGFALLGGRMIDRRKRRTLPDYDALRARSRKGRVIPPRGEWPAVAGRLLAGLVLYGVLLTLHGPVIGVSPLP
ncbi:NnrU family protein [Celeribacter indicus]|nr:NnrU family protein [Celeribacter indicus]SDW85959.1 Uncharacterized membrane protein [Celeribacter indicus]